MRPAPAAFVALAVLGTAVASYLAFLPSYSGRLAFWAIAGAPPCVLGILASVWAGREDFLRQWLGPRWGDATRGVVGAGALFMAAWAFARYVAPVGSAHEIWLVSLYGQFGDPRSLQSNAAALGAFVAVVALAEELVWRGMVAQLLADRIGSRMAWIGAAFLYALSYVPTMWALHTPVGLNPVLVLAALAGGLLWGGMARAFGSLVPGFVAHAFFDWAALVGLPLWGRGVGS